MVKKPGLATVISMAALTGVARAQGVERVEPAGGDIETPVEPTEATYGAQDGRTSLEFVAGSSYSFDADIDGDAGDLSIFRTGASVGVNHAVSERFRLNFAGRYVLSEYDFDDPRGLLPGVGASDEPFDTLHDASVGVGGFYGISERWSAFGTVNVGAAFEGGADFGESITITALGGASWQAAEDVRLTFGVLVASRLEDDELAIPIGGVEWDFAEGWRLSVGAQGETLSLTALDSPLGGEVSYEPCDATRVYARVGYQTRRYRLDSDNAFAPDGLFEDQALTVGGGLDWRAAAGLTVRLYGGATVFRQIDFEDAQGRDISDEETDVQPVIGGLIELRY